MGGKSRKMIGVRFGNLLVLSSAEKRNGSMHWNCVCDCGKNTVVDGRKLRSSSTKSCGCMRTGYDRNHKFVGTVVLKAWKNIKQRCYNPNSANYHLYGACGTGMFEGWRKDFISFCTEMGEYPSEGLKYTVGRIDNTLGYIPGNVRWETYDQQNKKYKPESKE